MTAAGEVLGDRYRLERPIGEGGMGEVWAATHVITLKPVAVKILKAVVGETARAHQRFMQEVRASCSLEHEAIPSVHDAFVEDGAPIIVMDLLSGETLGDRLKRVEQLTLDELVVILTPVIEALCEAHGKSIAHRDLKPDNIFLADDGAKVLDFGLAKLLGARSANAALRTKVGVVLGTPGYMAPEQARGDADVDHRVDVWALGVIVYRCLSGVRPIEGDNAAEILSRLATDAITPLHVIEPDLPSALTELVGRMLVREPEGRPGDLREVLAVLRSSVAQSNVAQSNVAQSNVAQSNVAQSNVAQSTESMTGASSLGAEPTTPGMPARSLAPMTPVPAGFTDAPTMMAPSRTLVSPRENQANLPSPDQPEVRARGQRDEPAITPMESKSSVREPAPRAKRGGDGMRIAVAVGVVVGVVAVAIIALSPPDATPRSASSSKKGQPKKSTASKKGKAKKSKKAKAPPAKRKTPPVPATIGVADGRPTAGFRGGGMFLWREANGPWMLRLVPRRRGPGRPRVNVLGTVQSLDVAIDRVHRLRNAAGEKAEIKGDTVHFALFPSVGAGIDIHTARPACLLVDVHVNGQRYADRVHLGRGSTSPEKVPFIVCDGKIRLCYK